jgi:hypothetical protein
MRSSSWLLGVLLLVLVTGCPRTRTGGGDAGPYDGPPILPPPPPPTGALAELFTALDDATADVCPCLVPSEYDTVERCMEEIEPSTEARSCSSRVYATMRSGEVDSVLRCLADLYRRAGSCVTTMGCSAALMCGIEESECATNPTFDAFSDAVDACLTP